MGADGAEHYYRLDMGNTFGGDCSNIWSGGKIGGLVGKLSQGTMEVCKNWGDVSGGANTYVGGLVGELEGSYPGTDQVITDCVNKGNVAGLDDTNVGGLVGYISFGTLEESRNEGSVVGGDRTDNQEAGRIGGLVGRLEYGYIESCANSGHVTGGANTQVGGLAGSSWGTLKSNTNTGIVTGGDNAMVGGLVGKSSDTLLGNTSTGTVSGGKGAKLGALFVDGLSYLYSLESLSVIQEPLKTVYRVGEPLSIDGLKVVGTGIYDGGGETI